MSQAIQYEITEDLLDIVTAWNLLVNVATDANPACAEAVPDDTMQKSLERFIENIKWVVGKDDNRVISTVAIAHEYFDDYPFYVVGLAVARGYQTPDQFLGIMNSICLIPGEDRRLRGYSGNFQTYLDMCRDSNMIDMKITPATNPLLVEINAEVPPCPQQ